MKFRFSAPLLLITSSISIVSANEYQTFIDLEHTSHNFSGRVPDFSSNNIFAQHFFSLKESLGPLGEFEYINTTSHVFGNYHDNDFYSLTSVGGEYFMGNFLIGGSYQDSDNDDSNSLTLGYLFSENFIIKLHSGDENILGTDLSFSASYNYQLGGNDYIGFSYSTAEDFDYQSLSSTYFTQLEGDSYLKVEVAYDYYEYRKSSASIEANYFFDKMTSVSLQFDNDSLSNYSVGMKHYLNDNFAFYANYRDIDTPVTGMATDTYQIGFSAQF